MNYKDLLILRLSNLTEWKNEKEMIIPSGMVIDWQECSFHTCEFFGDGRHKLRGYYENGDKGWEADYKNDRIHGRSDGWYKNGNKHWEYEYQNNLRHGRAICWCESGDIYTEEEYVDGGLGERTK